MRINFSLFFLLAICLAAASFRAVSWVPFTVDERLSVQFPAQPQPKDMGTALVKMFSMNNVTGTYIIMRTTLGANFVGSHRDNYYDALCKGFTQTGKGEVYDRTSFELGGYKGLEFTATATNPKTGKPLTICARCLLVDKVAYVLQFIPTDPSSKDIKAQREPFFSSMVLKPGTVSNN